MRVIERGNADAVWPRRFTCPTCKSVLELDLEDVKRNEDYTGDFTSFFINCPVCGGQPDVPQFWWDTVHRLKRPGVAGP